MTSVIAAGDGFLSGGRFRGIASESSLVLVKISSPRGQVKERDIGRGLRWLIDTYKRFNVRVVNLSVGGDDESRDPEHHLHQAVRRLTEAGIVVVAASGNHGRERLVPPASAVEAITVGGYDDHNTTERSQWTGYHSDYGLAYDGSIKPDVVAPANWIASPILPGSLVDREAHWLGPLLESESERALKRLLAQGYSDLGLPRELTQRPDNHLYDMLQARINSHKLIDAKHQHVDGTSVSAAIVSGVVAQMIEANPSLTPAQIKSILVNSAHPLNGVPSAQQGAGAIDPARAVQVALEAG
jgi:serine protease AprX